MPLNPATRRRLDLTRAQIPSFIEAWSEIFRPADTQHEDEQHEALVNELRACEDVRSHLFAELENALPPEARPVLLALEKAWSEEAAAREDAAYMIGAVIGQTRPICYDCQTDRQRAAVVASSWRRFSRLAARTNR